MAETLQTKALIIAATVAVFAAEPSSACSPFRINLEQARAVQTQTLPGADLVFLARVTGQASTDDPNLGAVFYEPIELVSGDAPMPAMMSVAVPSRICPPPSLGETHLILMRSADVSPTPDRTSHVLRDYLVSDVAALPSPIAIIQNESPE